MTRVYVDMVADLFHSGHVAFLRRAKELGDVLVVGIHTDEVCTNYKRRPVMSMEERAAVVAACRYVDEVILDAPIVVDREWVERHEVDVVVHGDDFSDEDAQRLYPGPMEMGIFRTLPYTPGVSTSEILDRIRRRLTE
jgi:glycerol-3-phosphate cytidylyltransferase